MSQATSFTMHSIQIINAQDNGPVKGISTEVILPLVEIYQLSNLLTSQNLSVLIYKIGKILYFLKCHRLAVLTKLDNAFGIKPDTF